MNAFGQIAPARDQHSNLTTPGKGFLYVAVDRPSKLVFARIYRKATKLAAAASLKVLVRTVP